MTTHDVEVVLAGSCSAIKINGRCTCLGFASAGVVAGYQTCTCGHTQQVRGLTEPVAPATGRPPAPARKRRAA